MKLLTLSNNWRGSALPPSDEGGGFAVRRRRRERRLPLSQPVRLTAPLTRGAFGVVIDFGAKQILQSQNATPRQVVRQIGIGLFPKFISDKKSCVVAFGFFGFSQQLAL